jgi:hypothetical protein
LQGPSVMFIISLMPGYIFVSPSSLCLINECAWPPVREEILTNGAFVDTEDTFSPKEAKGTSSSAKSNPEQMHTKYRFQRDLPLRMPPEFSP